MPQPCVLRHTVDDRWLFIVGVRGSAALTLGTALMIFRQYRIVRSNTRESDCNIFFARFLRDDVRLVAMDRVTRL